jgi:NifU-like protein involved in Fe-S cluster formation
MTKSPFSDVLMDHFLHPRRAGDLPDPSGVGWGGDPESSRYMRIQVQLDQDHIVEARFATYGCAPAIACGSYLCDRSVGRTSSEAQTFTADDLALALGGLPESRFFCAHLAVDALHAALQNASERVTTP